MNRERENQHGGQAQDDRQQQGEQPMNPRHQQSGGGNPGQQRQQEPRQTVTDMDGAENDNIPSGPAQ